MLLIFACANPDSGARADRGSTSPEDSPGDDADGDGHGAGEDCDDEDAAVHPGAAETPYDGVDNDCDPATPDDDLDGDGLPLAEDCDDADPAAGGVEVGGDGVDNDCDPATGDDGRLDGDLRADFSSFCEGWSARSLGGDLDLSAATADEVATLGCLGEVDGDRRVAANPTLTDLDGLALTRVGGSLVLDGNPALVDLGGLDALVELGGDLYVHANPALVGLSGLDQLAAVGQQALVDDNDALVDLGGLSGLSSVGAGFALVGNDALTDLAGLGGLRSVVDFFFVVHNGALVGLDGLDSLTEVDGSFTLHDNPELVSLGGLAGLTEVHGNLVIAASPSLTHLDGLDQLQSVGVSLGIHHNDGLVDLRGLGGLGSVGLDLVLYANAALADLGATELLYRVGNDVVLSHDPALAEAQAEAFVAGIDDIGGEVRTEALGDGAALPEFAEAAPAGGDCVGLPAAPLEPVELAEPRGYHDVGFDDEGRMIGWSEEMLVAATATTRELPVPGFPEIHGMDRLPDGDWVAATDGGELYRFGLDGSRETLASGLGTAYDAVVAPDGSVWVTSHEGVFRVDPDGGVVEALIDLPPDLVPHALNFDLDSTGAWIGVIGAPATVLRQPLDEDLRPAGELERYAEVGLGFHDALGVDACGNLYVADYNTSALYRVVAGEVQTLVPPGHSPGYGHGAEWGDGGGDWPADRLYQPQPYDDDTVRELAVGVTSGESVRTWRGEAVSPSPSPDPR